MPEIYGFAINVEGNAIKSISAIDGQLNVLEKNAQKTDSVFGGLFKFEMLKQGFNVIKNMASETYTFGKQMEQTMLSLEVMTGSKDKAKALQQELKHLADISPMVDSAIYDGAKQLLNYGIQSEKVAGYMSMLGDISAGSTDKFQRLSYVFGQVSAQGYLQGQDLRQMVDAGFNPLNEMVKTTGKQYSELTDMMSKKKISFNMVVEAMKQATGEGGRFNNMMVRQSQTVGGLQSTLEGTFQTIMYGSFQRMSPMLKDILSSANDVALKFAEWITPKQSEILSDQRAEMMALFEILKNSNTPLDTRRSIISKLNTEYGEQIGKEITLQTSASELAKLQNEANKTMIDRIKIISQQEILKKYFDDATRVQNELFETQMKVEEDKAKGIYYKYYGGGSGYGTMSSKVSVEDYYHLATVQKKYDESQKELEKRLKFFGSSLNPEDLKVKGLNEAFNLENDKLKNALDKVTNPQGKSNSLKGVKSYGYESGTDAFTENAMATSKSATGGGLGQAKVINMNFNQPLMQINAGTIDGQDMESNAEKVVEQLASELHQMAYETGSV